MEVVGRVDELRGDAELVGELQQQVKRFRLLLQDYAPIPAQKRLLALVTGEKCWANVRPPLLPMPEAQGRELLETLRSEFVVRAEGRVRARPILLTSVTTFLGISPLIFFATGQTAFLSPMAVSLGFGIVFATAITLVLVPALYRIFEDLTAIGRRVSSVTLPEASSCALPRA